MVCADATKPTRDDVGKNAAVIKPVLRLCPGANPSVTTLQNAIVLLYSKSGITQDPAVDSASDGAQHSV